MVKKQRTIYSACGLIVGIVAGIAGTAFSLVAEKQRINDTLTRHSTEMIAMKADDEAHEKTTQKELDRFSEIISSQISLIQSGISELDNTVGDLRGDVRVLKALMERMEEDARNNANHG